MLKNSLSFSDDDCRKAILQYTEAQFANGTFVDPSCVDKFARRDKSIRFVMVHGDNLYCLSQDYFIQNQNYNEVSGGYKRHYNLIPDEIIRGPARKVILEFAKTMKLEEKALILVQIQTSTVRGTVRESVTGQGIHTDGSNRAALWCVQRENVAGADNIFYNDLQGNEPLCEPRVLNENDVVMFKDDEVFHCVTRVGRDDEEGPGKRCICLMHYPAEMYLDGATNANNNLGALSFEEIERSRNRDKLTRQSQLFPTQESVAAARAAAVGAAADKSLLLLDDAKADKDSSKHSSVERNVERDFIPKECGGMLRGMWNFFGDQTDDGVSPEESKHVVNARKSRFTRLLKTSFRSKSIVNSKQSVPQSRRKASMLEDNHIF